MRALCELCYQNCERVANAQLNARRCERFVAHSRNTEWSKNCISMYNVQNFFFAKKSELVLEDELAGTYTIAISSTPDIHMSSPMK